MRLRVLTWNLARRRRLRRVLEFLEDQRIDLALLQETPAVTGYRQRYAAVWSPSLQPDCRILARQDLPLQLVKPSPLERFGSHACVATVEVPGLGQLLVASFHALARRAHREELDELDPEVVRRPRERQPWLNDLAFHLLAPVCKGRFLIGCDINTCRAFDDGQFVHRAREAGWSDLTWRHLERELPTMFKGGRRGHQVYQLDHLFADERLACRLQDLMVDTSVADVVGDGTSDHAPVIATFALDREDPMRRA